MASRIKVQLPDWRQWLADRAGRSARDSRDYDLHLAAAEWALSSALDINRLEDFISLPSPSVEPFAHQVDDAILFFRRLAPRGLIADDVGLGKTVTAGLVARELLDRGRVDSVLVVCPKSLVEQWQEELDSKFAMKAIIGVGGDFSDLDRHPFWITSYHTARSRIDTIRARKFDLLILDEAHALRNLFGQQNAPQVAKAFEQLMKDDAVRYCLMLTATPIQNRLWDIFSLLEVLKAPQPNPLGTPDRFRSVFIEDQAARRLRRGTEDDFRRKVAEATIRTRRFDTGLIFPEREVKTQRLTPLAEEKAFIDDALAAILAMTANKLVQMTHARTLMSSPWAASAAFEREAEKPGVSEALRARLSALARRGRTIGASAKVDAVVRLAKQSVVRDAPGRLIVFTQRLETLRHLAEALTAAGFGQHVAIIQGGQPEANRRSIRDFMADSPARPILLSTDTGAVGLNLQAGNIVVNYDLPWNPMLLEQRIGRVQRLGQKARKVILYNLVLQGTIEEHVVLRLIEKLNLFNQAIGEMEELLELCGYDDEDRSLEQVIMDLIQKAAEQRDIEADLRKMEESRLAAETKMREMREATEQALASIRPKDIDARLEGLERISPRVDLPELVRASLKRAGADFREEEGGRLFVRVPGGTAELIFDRKARPVPGDQLVRVVVPGTRAFDHITKPLREDVAHHFVDATAVDLEGVRSTIEGLLTPAGITVDGLRVVRREPQAALRIAIRGAVSVPTDRYETIFEVDQAREEDGVLGLLGAVGELKASDGTPFPRPSDARVEELSRRLEAVEPKVIARARAHESVQRFHAFYEARYEEDLVRLLEHARTSGYRVTDGDPESSLEAIGSRDPGIRSAYASLCLRFIPSLKLEPLGVSGIAYEEVEVEARVRNRHQRRAWGLRVRAIPLTGIVGSPIPGLDEIPAGREAWACSGGHLVPAEEFIRCSTDGCTAGACRGCRERVVVGPAALWECADCRSLLCEDHRSTCVSCERSLCNAHAFRLSNSSQAACGRCSEQLEDGTRLLQSEVGTSTVSGVRAPASAMEPSAISGRIALAGELVECEESGRRVLPDEVVTCAITGRRVARDLVEPSAVSGRQGVRSRMKRSDVSGRSCLPGEERICDESGALLLPDEVGVCAVTGRQVRQDLLEEDAEDGRPALRRLLQQSNVSGRWSRPEKLQTSALSGRVGLEHETASCEICHRRLLEDEMQRCQETGRRGCPEHFVTCEVSGDQVVPEALTTCEVTGRKVRQALVASCPETGRRALKTLFEPCEATGTAVLPQALERSSVSGKRVRRSLLVSCAVSGQRALPEELVACTVSGKLVRPDLLLACPETGARFLADHGIACEESGKLVVPAAVGQCAKTGRRVARSLLGRDDVSGKTVLSRLLQTCAITGQHTVEENLVTSSVTGRLGLRERAVKCEVTGRPALPGELARCGVSGKTVHPDLLISCPETGTRMLPDVAERCLATGVPVSPDGLATCEATGKRLRRSLVATDEVSGQSVTEKLLLPCERTGRRTLAANLVTSAVSGRRVLADIVQRCEETGAPALPEELARCDVSGRLVLPGLLDRCAVSGRQVLRNLLRACEVTGKRVLPEHLSACRRAGKTALTSLFGYSELSGESGLAEILMTCEATQRQVFPDELVTTQVTGRRVGRDRVVSCSACNRTCDVAERLRCSVCGQFYCPDDCRAGVCTPCRGLVTRISGRALSAVEIRLLSAKHPWARRGWMVESKGLVHVHLESGRLSFSRRSALVVLTRPIAKATGVVWERPLDQNLIAKVRGS